MASQRQIGFFQELLNDRTFPDGTDPQTLAQQFASLSQNAASEWIDKAMKLPKRDAGKGDNTPPPF